MTQQHHLATELLNLGRMTRALCLYEAPVAKKLVRLNENLVDGSPKVLFSNLMTLSPHVPICSGGPVSWILKMRDRLSSFRSAFSHTRNYSRFVENFEFDLTLMSRGGGGTICHQLSKNHLLFAWDKGPFSNYVDTILLFFDPPLRGQFLYPERGQKQTFFDPLPPLSWSRT